MIFFSPPDPFAILRLACRADICIDASAATLAAIMLPPPACRDL